MKNNKLKNLKKINLVITGISYGREYEIPYNQKFITFNGTAYRSINERKSFNRTDLLLRKVKIEGVFPAIDNQEFREFLEKARLTGFKGSVELKTFSQMSFKQQHLAASYFNEDPISRVSYWLFPVFWEKLDYEEEPEQLYEAGWLYGPVIKE